MKRDMEIEKLWSEVCYSGKLYEEFLIKSGKITVLVVDWFDKVLETRKTRYQLSDKEIVELHSKVVNKIELL